MDIVSREVCGKDELWGYRMIGKIDNRIILYEFPFGRYNLFADNHRILLSVDGKYAIFLNHAKRSLKQLIERCKGKKSMRKRLW